MKPIRVDGLPKLSPKRIAYSAAKRSLGLSKLFGVRWSLDIARHVDLAKRESGDDWPYSGETMVGLKRLDNLQECITDIVARQVPGDIIEAGVWRGGASIFMRAVLKILGDTSRQIWLADSFGGLPRPNPEIAADEGINLWRYPVLAVSLDNVKANFDFYGMMDDNVKFLPGYFNDTLPTAPIERLSLIRLDGDLYESTMDSFKALYPKLSIGGHLIQDDYNAMNSAKLAVDDF